MVDEKQMPWVINMTHDPSLKIHYEDEDAIVQGRKAKQEVSETDLYVNKMVISDTIKLAKKSRDQLNEVEVQGSLRRLHEGPDAQDGEVYTTVCSLMTLFYSVTVIRSKA